MAYNTNKLEVILKHEFGDMKMSDVNYPRWESLKASIIAMLYLYTRSIVWMCHVGLLCQQLYTFLMQSDCDGCQQEHHQPQAGLFQQLF